MLKSLGQDGLREETRLAVVRSLGLATLSPASIDAVTRLAAKIFDVPVSLATLIDADTQHFVGAHGTDLRETPRSIAFCDHALQIPEDEIFAVPDLAADARFRDNPLVTGPIGVRFYAGAPIRIDDQTVGTLCILDMKPREAPDEEAREQFLSLARIVSDLMDKSREARLREEVQRALEDERLRLGTALNSGDIVAWEYEPDTDRIVWHDQSYRYFGLTEEESASAAAFFMRVHPEDVDELRKHIGRVVAGTEPAYRATFRVQTSDGSWRWVVGAGEMHVTRGRSRLFGVNFDVSDERRIMDAREMAARELRHRIKNLIAVVGSIATGTARRSTDLATFLPAFRGRLQALGRGQDALLAEGTQSATLRALCEEALAPFVPTSADAIVIEAEETPVPSQHVSTVAMLLHELATNAVKHGALGDAQGRVALHAAIGDGAVTLDWTETHSRGCTRPETSGFGSLLIARAVSGAGGTIEEDWRPEGLHASVRLPV